MRLFEVANNLENIASHYEGAIYPTTGKSSDYMWKEYKNFPLKLFKEMTPQGWKEWFDVGLGILPERNYEILSQEDIQEPVIVMYHENSAYLWDGYHRVAASIFAGRKTIPAIVGTRK